MSQVPLVTYILDLGYGKTKKIILNSPYVHYILIKIPWDLLC